MDEPIKKEEKRNPDGTFAPGTSGGPGRPKGKTIKELVREWLEDNPEDMRAFVQYFVKRNKELAWRMLEGNPANSTDITTKGKPIPILGNVPSDYSNQEGDEPKEEN